MKFIIIAMCISLCTASGAQVNIINQSLTDSSLSILYIGANNQIKLKGVKSQAAMGHISISGPGNTLTKTGNFQNIARVRTPGKCKIAYTEYGKKVFEKEFKVEYLKYARASLSGLSDTIIKKNRILINPFLSIIIPGCYFRHNYSILSFQAIFIQDADNIPTETQGYQFSKEQIQLTKEMNSGGKIYFDQIRLFGPDSRLSIAPPFWIRIE